MQFDVPEEQRKAARQPHDLFLINLIFNHILLFVTFMSMASLQLFVLVVPVISFIVLSYTFWRAKRSLRLDPWFVKCHWQICSRRSRGFIVMLGLMAAVMFAMVIDAGFSFKAMHPGHWAIIGATVLPTMVTVLVLIIMESEALHQARFGLVPKGIVARFPEGALQPLDEDEDEDDGLQPQE